MKLFFLIFVSFLFSYHLAIGNQFKNEWLELNEENPKKAKCYLEKSIKLVKLSSVKRVQPASPHLEIPQMIFYKKQAYPYEETSAKKIDSKYLFFGTSSYRPFDLKTLFNEKHISIEAHEEDILTHQKGGKDFKSVWLPSTYRFKTAMEFATGLRQTQKSDKNYLKILVYNPEGLVALDFNRLIKFDLGIISHKYAEEDEVGIYKKIPSQNIAMAIVIDRIQDLAKAYINPSLSLKEQKRWREKFNKNFKYRYILTRRDSNFMEWFATNNE